MDMHIRYALHLCVSVYLCIGVYSIVLYKYVLRTLLYIRCIYRVKIRMYAFACCHVVDMYILYIDLLRKIAYTLPTVRAVLSKFLLNSIYKMIASYVWPV